MTELRPSYTTARTPKSAHFTVEGNPVPKARPRMVTKNGRTHAYTPKRSKTWEDEVGWAYRRACGPIFGGSVTITLRFYRRTKRRVDLDNPCQ